MFNSKPIMLLGVVGVWLAMPLLAASVDPTRPPSARAMISTPAAATKERPLVLQSIRISEQQRRALISGVTVSEGDRIRGSRVVSIEPGSVLLERGKKQIRLVLAGHSIKQFIQEQN